MLLLGGDLVENHRGLVDLRNLVASISNQCLIGAVSGNHDDSIGRHLVRDSVYEAGGKWLEDEVIQVTLKNQTIVILGCLSQFVQEQEYKILCAHYPNVFPKAAKDGIDLVLAGHLHGSQVVFLEKNYRLYPGAFLYRWNGLRFTIGRSNMLVSRGIADTFPIRWNCPREMIVCDLE